MKYGFQLKSFLILRKGITLNKGKPSESSLNIARNQEFELITSGHFKNQISPKLAWNSQWSLIPSSKPEHWNLVLITPTAQVKI